MIPLPGLVFLIWMIRVSQAVLAISILASIVSLWKAGAAWRANEPAVAAERLAWILMVPGLVLFLLFFPPDSWRLWIAATPPAFVSLATLCSVRLGNRRRGLASLDGRRVARSVLASLVGTVLMIAGSVLAVRAHQARTLRLEEEAAARGRSHQDDFSAAVARGSGVVVAGQTSTPPSADDDAWLMWLDRSLAIRSEHAPRSPKRQAIFALAGSGQDLVAAGQDDERPLWLRFDEAGNPAARKVWDLEGGMYALATLDGGATLMAGERAGAPFIAGVDAAGAEIWSATPGPKGRLQSVAVHGQRYLAAGLDDPVAMPGAVMILAGGTTDGKGTWARKPDSSRFSPAPHALAPLRTNEFLALGTTREMPGHMSDLWLARISGDGTILDELTFGGANGETAGGLALVDGRVFIAGYRFIPQAEELWLLEVDGDGNVVWEKTYGARSHGRPTALVVTSEGRLVLAGYREGDDLHRDGWVGIFDLNGETLEQKTWPSTRAQD